MDISNILVNFNMRKGMSKLPPTKQVDAPKNRNLINRLALNIRDGISNIYTKSYYTRPTNIADIKDIKDRMSQSINTIVSSNMDSMGEPNISRLLGRAAASFNDKDITNNIQAFFTDGGNAEALLQTYTENKYIVEMDQEIDTICKYMPKLEEALDTKKDNVLSADHFSKDFIFLKNSTTLPDSTYSERIKTLKDKYNLLTEVEEWYMTASKYGEQFLYIVPFNRAISKLLDARGEQIVTSNPDVARVTESSYIMLNEIAPLRRPYTPPNSNNLSIDIEFNTSGVLTESLIRKYNACKKAAVNSVKSLCEQVNYEIEQEILNEANKVTDKKEPDGKPVTNQSARLGSNPERVKVQNTVDASELDLTDFNSNASDGLILTKFLSNNKKKSSLGELNIPGCMIKRLDRSMVKPIYEEDICIGYLYLEVKDPDKLAFKSNIFDSVSGGLTNNVDISKDMKSKDDMLEKKLGNLAVQISRAIDAKFINSNVDLAKEIYVMLKRSDYVNNPSSRIKVTFLPAEDVIHIKFKEDPKTHRGISDLYRSLFPAKIYCAMYLVNAIGNMTRGYDRRVYYVKQAVDTNIAKNLLNTINQLKRCNFNIRQIENINNIIGIAGSLHDLLIPTMAGDSPIQFEIMPGQKIDPPTDMLNSLEEMSINLTDVPLELIQARQSMDYAVHYTMTNAKFLKKVYNRQSAYAKFLSVIMTKIYDYEFNTNDKLQVTLPPPMFLNITNTNQIMQNTNEFTNNITQMWMGDETRENVKNAFMKKVNKYYLGSYLELDVLEKLRIESEQEATIVQAQEA